MGVGLGILLLSHKHKLRIFIEENKHPTYIKIWQGIVYDNPYSFPIHSNIKYISLNQILYGSNNHPMESKTNRCIFLFHRASGGGGGSDLFDHALKKFDAFGQVLFSFYRVKFSISCVM